MRKRFKLQLVLGRLPIAEIKISTKERNSALPEICAILKIVFIRQEWNEKIFEILENKIPSRKQKTGDPYTDL